MIFQLGLPSFEVIGVTAQFSNAVLVAVLPYVSNVVQCLDLPVPHQITREHVTSCSIKPLKNDWGVELGIEGGWFFTFSRGYIDTVQGPHSFFIQQNPDRIPDFFGTVKISKDEAIELGRNEIRKLGIPLESVFAELEPRVTLPEKIGTNTIPHYRLEWLDPRAGTVACVDVDINGEAKRVERIRIFSRSLERPLPKIDVVPPSDSHFPFLPFPKINPDYAEKLVPFVLRAVDEYGQKLSLPIPRPLTTNHVAKLSLQENIGGPYCTLELTNGWEFLYEGTMVTEFRMPDNLFENEKRAIKMKDLLGKWNLTEQQAIELVKQTIAKFNHPTNLVHFEVKPQISKPAVQGIPRYMFYWYYSPEGYDVVQTAISAEVDADKGELKSLYYGHMAFWNHGPKIDVPITLPPDSETNTPADKSSASQLPKTPSRPFTVFPSLPK